MKQIAVSRDPQPSHPSNSRDCEVLSLKCGVNITLLSSSKITVGKEVERLGAWGGGIPQRKNVLAIQRDSNTYELTAIVTTCTRPA